MKGSAVDIGTILLVGSIAFTLLMLSMGVYYIVGTTQGTCWAETFNKLKDIQARINSIDVGESDGIFVSFDSCVNFVFLENYENIEKTLNTINSASDTMFDTCSNQTRSGDEIKTVLASIKQSDAEYSWTDIVKDPENKEKFATYVRSFAGLGEATHCISLACPNCTVIGKINLPINGKEKKYCIFVTKKSEFVYSIDNQIQLDENAGPDDCEEPII